MRCKKCGHRARISAQFCAKCGAPVARSESPADSIASSLDSVRDEIQRELDSATESLDAELNKTVQQAPVVRRDLSVPASPQIVHQSEWVSLVEPQEDQVDQSANFVFRSPFIRGNAQYKDRVSHLAFAFIRDTAIVNAFATDQIVELPGGGSTDPPAVVFFGGLARSIRLASAALAADIRSRADDRPAPVDSGLSAAFQEMGKAITSSGGMLELATTLAIFERTVLPVFASVDERTVSVARSYSAAMDMYVVAHETGHIALAHTLGQQLNYDVSRNQEREADSFASSTLSTSPFREYLFLGQVFVTETGTGTPGTDWSTCFWGRCLSPSFSPGWRRRRE